MSPYTVKEIEKKAYSLVRRHFYNACWNVVHPELSHDTISAVPHLVLFPESFQNEWCDVSLVDASDISSKTTLSGGRMMCIVNYFGVSQTVDDLDLEWKDSEWLIPWLTDWYGHYREIPSLSDPSSISSVHIEDSLNGMEMKARCTRAAMFYVASHGSSSSHCHH